MSIVTEHFNLSLPVAQETSSRLVDIRAVKTGMIEADLALLDLQNQINNCVGTKRIGMPDGVAGLDANGIINADQLPSYVDDVEEYTTLAAFPATGQPSKIYLETTTGKAYRWSGSQYVYITSGAVDSVAGKTGVVTLDKADVGLGNVDNTADLSKPVSSAQLSAINAAKAEAIAASTPAEHEGSGGNAHAVVTTTSNGFMSASDKVKLNAITGTNTGDQTTVSGNAGTATRLQTARKINGVDFDGSADITITSSNSTIPKNARGAYTLALSDAGKNIYTAAGGVTWTIPANGQVPFPEDSVVGFINASAVPVTITIISDTLIRSKVGIVASVTLAAYGAASAVKVSATSWFITGDLS